MTNRLTDREVLDFIELNELRDYTEYVEEKVESGEVPLTLVQWRQANP